MTIQQLSTERRSAAIKAVLDSVNAPKQIRPKLSYTDFVNVLEERLLLGETVDDIVVVDLFTPGMYVRECRMPANRIIIGAEHKTEHPYTISKGEIMVLTENGIATLRAPFTGISKPGARRVGLTIRDTVFTTYHATNLTSVDEILEEITIRPHNRLLS